MDRKLDRAVFTLPGTALWRRLFALQSRRPGDRRAIDWFGNVQKRRRNCYLAWWNDSHGTHSQAHEVLSLAFVRTRDLWIVCLGVPCLDRTGSRRSTWALFR